MTAPQNILDAICDAMVKPRELKEMLVTKAWLLRQQCIAHRYSEQTAKDIMRGQLVEWLKSRHFPGKGRKRLLDKVISEVMSTYGSMLRACLHADANQFEREAKGFAPSSYGETVNRRRARDIRSNLSAGKVGRGKHR
jgi:hypothetical protein